VLTPEGTHAAIGPDDRGLSMPATQAGLAELSRFVEAGG
jgi:hypothetical protein